VRQKATIGLPEAPYSDFMDIEPVAEQHRDRAGACGAEYCKRHSPPPGRRRLAQSSCEPLWSTLPPARAASVSQRRGSSPSAASGAGSYSATGTTRCSLRAASPTSAMAPPGKWRAPDGGRCALRLQRFSCSLVWAKVGRGLVPRRPGVAGPNHPENRCSRMSRLRHRPPPLGASRSRWHQDCDVPRCYHLAAGGTHDRNCDSAAY
jgi:hypothetical protein